MADSVSYKCPNCGAPLSFIPGKKTVTCEYCGTEFEVAAIEEMFAGKLELAARTEEAQNSNWDIAGAGGWNFEPQSFDVFQLRRGARLRRKYHGDRVRLLRQPHHDS